MKWVKANSESIKRQNRKMVLEILRNHPNLSRSDLSRMTGLNKVTMSELTDEFIDEDLVEVAGNGSSHVGRKPKLLRFRGSSAYVIGVELTGVYGRLLCVNLSNERILYQRFRITLSSKEAISEQIGAFIRSVLPLFPENRYGVLGIGVAVRGVVDPDGHTIVQFPDLNAVDGYNLGESLEEDIGVPVIVDNRANAAVWGEHVWGTAQHCRSAIYLSFARHGIGSGIIVGNELYRGHSGFAGEISHIPIDGSGPSCTCGCRGCWRAYVGESGVRDACEQHGVYLQDAIEDEGGSVLPWVAKRADEGDAACREALWHIGEYLGLGLVNVVNMLNPEVIYIGNRMALAFQWVLPAIQQALTRRCHSSALKELKITIPEEIETAVVRGAAALVMDSCITRLAARAVP